MRVFREVLVSALGVTLLALSAVPYFAKKVPAAQEKSDAGRSYEIAGRVLARERVPVAGAKPAAPQMPAHRDHTPKHGGTFFMAMDYKHHLEGVLIPPATFRVYLYDDHTKPLQAQETRKTSGTVQIGNSVNAPKITLGPGKRSDALEARLGKGVKFPVKLTLLLHLPGMAPNAKPELFNFTFTHFSDESAGKGCGSMPNMPSMSDKGC